VWQNHNKIGRNPDFSAPDIHRPWSRIDEDLRKMAADLEAGACGRGRRSPLFRWIYTRADAVQQILADVQPTWESVAKALTTRKLTDGAGKPPTAERARKTWFEVRALKGWIASAKPPPPDAALPHRTAPERAPVAFDDPPVRTFGTGRLRGHTASRPPVAPPAACSTPADPDRAAKVLAELMRDAPANRFKPDDGE
jgi:hypothetical protein